MSLFDASALLCFLQGETGSDVVERELGAGAGRVSAANWSEVAQKCRARQQDWGVVKALLGSYRLAVEPVLAADAENAAFRWVPGAGLSIADRLCLATADRLEVTVWTADNAWGQSDRVRQVRGTPR